MKGHVRFGYNQVRNAAPLYRGQRSTLLSHDIYGNVQKLPFNAYWSPYGINANVHFLADYGEVPNPDGGPYCANGLTPERTGNINQCVIKGDYTPVTSDLFLWSGCGSQRGYYY